MCQILQKKLGHGKRFAFADPIKEIAAEYFGIPRELGDAPNDMKNTTYTDWLWEEIPCLSARVNDDSLPGTINGKNGRMTVREILQWIGTEIFRLNMHKDFWVKATFNRIKADCSSYFNLIGFQNSEPGYEEKKENLYFITDVRFPNEVQSIKDAGGIVVRVIRDSVVSSDPHPSETALDEWDKMPVAVEALTETKKLSGVYKNIGSDPYNYYLRNNDDLSTLENICASLADEIKRKLPL